LFLVRDLFGKNTAIDADEKPVARAFSPCGRGAVSPEWGIVVRHLPDNLRAENP
jgi:hypothetical protein